MKKLAIGLVIVIAIVVFVSYNVWRATVEPVTTPPTLVELGRQQLHDQLQNAIPREAQIERQDWNSIPLLRQLIDSHQHRIEQLSGNTQAGEIVAHDKDAIARLQKRIADLTAAATVQPAMPESASPQDEPGGQKQPRAASTPASQSPRPTAQPAQTPR